MKDAMEVITTKIEAVRVSKTSIKEWHLFGPIDQALKTSIQTTAVKVHPLSITVHDVPVDLALWVDARPVEQSGAPPNPNATLMLALQAMRDRGEETDAIELGPGMVLKMVSLVNNQNTQLVTGAAILTGAGGMNLPKNVDWQCLMAALIGRHSD